MPHLPKESRAESVPPGFVMSRYYNLTIERPHARIGGSELGMAR